MQTHSQETTGGTSNRIPPLHYEGKKNLKRSAIFSLIGALLLLAVSVLAFFPSILSHKGAHAAPANTAVLTYKGDNGRTGQYAQETTLNTSNVTASQFGKRVSYPIDGQAYAQPLYVPNLSVNGSTHNVVFAATEHDSVYAFDADQTSSTPAALWQTSFLTGGATSVPYTDVQCNDMTPEIGITGTPAIDSSSGTMYVVSYTKENGNEVYRLHALDVATGQDKPGSPIVIQASVQGTGSGASNGTVTFNPLKERQRGALLLANGQIYIPFGSFCDNGPYHGWILGYTYNGSAFQQADVYNDTANGSGGGIWGSGGAIASDTNGNIYFMSGNGDANVGTGGTEAGDTFGKLNAQLQLQDFMTPFNASCMQVTDADLGSGGPLILSSLNEQIGGGKEGRVYVINNNNMGKYTADASLNCNTSEHLRTDVDKILQELPPSTVGGIYSTPAFWNGPNGQFVYLSGSGGHTKAFQLSNGLLSTNPTSQIPESLGFTGGNAVVSSNGTTSGTGIVWIVDPKAVLRAYDATNLATELYNSSQNTNRDGLDSFEKFTTPVVANGEVFVGTTDALTIYGLLSSTSLTPSTTPSSPTSTSTPSGSSYNNIGISDDSAPTTANFDYSGSSYSAQALQTAGINPGDNAFYNGMVFTWPNAVPGTLDNYIANGQTVPVTPLSNANILGFLGAATGGPSSGSATINYTDGTTQPFTLGFSDWTLGGGGQSPSFGNGTMATLLYRNTPSGKESVNTYVFYAEIAMQTGKTVQSVNLPTTVDQGVLHIFAVSTKQGTSTSTPTPTPTPPPVAYNNRGISDDSSPGSGNFDGVNSYSAQALQSAGITPGNPVVFNGVTFTWPNVASGKSNNYKAQGQVIPITPISGATTLAFLGSATGGASTGSATITYSDGTTQTFTLGLSDWTLGGGHNSPSFGNQVVATTAYRNTPTGQQTTDKPVILYTDIALQAGKTINSVTLPLNSQLHVFTIATK